MEKPLHFLDFYVQVDYRVPEFQCSFTGSQYLQPIIRSYCKDSVLIHFGPWLLGPNITRLYDELLDSLDDETLSSSELIEMLLLLGGVEQNPGPLFGDRVRPSECQYQGQRVQGEWMRRSGRMVLICPGCPLYLLKDNGAWPRSGIAMHPGQPAPDIPVEVRDSDQAPIPVPEIKVQDPGPLVGDERRVASVLDGCLPSDDDCCAIASRYLSCPVQRSWCSCVTQILHFENDERLVCFRDVKVNKSPMIIAQIKVTCPLRTRIWWVVLCLMLLLVSTVITWSIFDDCGYYSFLSYLLCCFMFFFDPVIPEHVIYIPFVPHVISCVLTEFDRGTSPVACRSTLRQKIRRLAALPIPDYDYIKFVAGSELVVEQLLSSADFFGEGVACLRQDR